MAAPGGLVAFSVTPAGAGAASGVVAASSADGAAWSQGSLIPGLESVDLAAATAGRILACGPAPGTESRSCAISTDGEVWTAGAAGTMPEALQATIAAAGGRFLLAGLDAARGVRAWQSADGRSWASIAAPGGAERIEQLVVDGDVSVAVGTVRERDRRLGDRIRPAIWASTDGRTWHRATVPVGLGERLVVARHAGWFVALAAGQDRTPLIMVSDDGRFWRLVLSTPPAAWSTWPPGDVAGGDAIVGLGFRSGERRLAIGRLEGAP